MNLLTSAGQSSFYDNAPHAMLLFTSLYNMVKRLIVLDLMPSTYLVTPQTHFTAETGVVTF
jgi:hypothetical protein